MDMIRTFRIVALNKETHRIRDYKYTESYIISGTSGIVSYYDDEFNALSTDTIDLTQWSVRAMPNKTSRIGAYYKKRPLPTIASLMPIITTVHYIPRKIPIDVIIPAFTPVLPNITVAKM